VESERARLDEVSVTAQAGAVESRVRLAFQSENRVGTAESRHSSDATPRAAARAALAALEQLFDGVRFELDELAHQDGDATSRITAVVTMVEDDASHTHVGAAIVTDDPAHAAVRAALDAVNRKLSRSLHVISTGDRSASGPAMVASASSTPPGDLVGIASHQLRGPVGIMVGYLQTLSSKWDSLDDDGRRSMIARSIEQGERLVRRLENLLTIAGDGGVAPRTRPGRVAVADAVRDALGDVDAGHGAAVEVAVEVPDDLEAFVDADHLVQIVTNLLDNALRHGRPPVLVRARRADARIELAVTDRGQGIPEALAETLFAGPVTNGEETRSAGSGLGLYITRLLAEANAGTIGHARAPGGGTRMTLSVPAADG
jgi:K+-sensing histidine kinase KdpD